MRLGRVGPQWGRTNHRCRALRAGGMQQPPRARDLQPNTTQHTGCRSPASEARGSKPESSWVGPCPPSMPLPLP